MPHVDQCELVWQVVAAVGYVGLGSSFVATNNGQPQSSRPTEIGSQASEDGAVHSLYAAAHLMGRTITLDNARAALPGPARKSYSLQDVGVAAERLGLPLELRRLSRDRLLAAPVPCILQLAPQYEGSQGRFVVLLGITPESGLWYIEGNSRRALRTIWDDTRHSPTGYGLFPREISPPLHVVMALSVSTFLIGITWGFWASRGRRA